MLSTNQYIKDGISYEADVEVDTKNAIPSQLLRIGKNEVLLISYAKDKDGEVRSFTKRKINTIVKVTLEIIDDKTGSLVIDSKKECYTKLHYIDLEMMRRDYDSIMNMVMW